MNIEQNTETFKKILRETNRNGVEAVIERLEELGFFTAPASSKHHLAEEGGLCQHCLNVYMQADSIRSAQIRLDNSMSEKIPMDSLTIVSLLHDVCKADVYKKGKKWRKDKDGKWEQYDAWDTDYTTNPLDHGVKSVVMLMRAGLELNDAEIAAIRWHMAGWDLSDYRESRECFGKSCDKYPLLSVLIAADELATRITEVNRG